MTNIPKTEAITPDSKIGALLELYPQLEERLMQMSPAYGYLRNPILRRTVAKVATLRQVAKVGNVPLATLINTLRQSVGIEAKWSSPDVSGSIEQAPEWMRDASVAKTFDARPVIAGGGHPLEQVLGELHELHSGEIFLLITPFLPAPLLDVIKRKGHEVWTKANGEGLYENYLLKKG
jgi:hypothetical protein